MVINKEGLVKYRNKSYEDIFGIPESIASKNHYAVWMKLNK